MLCLKKLLPEPMHNLMRIDAQHQHSISSDYKIISVSNEIAVPISSSSVYRIDFLDDSTDGHKVCVKWPGELPKKCKLANFKYGYLFLNIIFTFLQGQI